MNPGRFFMPRMGIGMGPTTGANFMSPRSSLGLFGRLTSTLKTFNWSGLINGANKTLNVVNQTIPLVRQAGPMFNNMKSMLRLAKVFGNETNNRNFINTNNKNKDNISYNDTNNNDLSINEHNNNLVQKKEVSNNSYPNFFV